TGFVRLDAQVVAEALIAAGIGAGWHVRAVAGDVNGLHTIFRRKLVLDADTGSERAAVATGFTAKTDHDGKVAARVRMHIGVSKTEVGFVDVGLVDPVEVGQVENDGPHICLRVGRIISAVPVELEPAFGRNGRADPAASQGSPHEAFGDVPAFLFD